MTAQLLRNRLIRSAVYVYFAAGAALLLNLGFASIVRFAPEKGLALGYLLIAAVGIFALLALSNWDSYARPLSARKWIVLCAFSSFGFVNAILLARLYTGSGAL